MRLGQLSRKIGVQQSSISTFLEKKNYVLEAGSNSKLTEEQEILVKAHFDYIEEEVIEQQAHELNNEPVVEPLQPTSEEVVEESVVIEAEESVVEVEAIVDEEEITETISEESLPIPTPSTEIETDEVIRAPKLKLEGLKVVGKIELPEPKVKEEPESKLEDHETSSIKEVEDKPVRKKMNQRGFGQNLNKNRRPQKRTLTLEEKQKREQQVKKRRYERLKEQQKQLKTAHYESKMRERKPVSPKKNKRKPSINTEKHTEKINTSPAPKTLFGKFMRWLNT